MLVFTVSTKITHLLTLWLKYPVKWTSNSISLWLRKWLPLFTLAHGCFGSGWLFSLRSRWPKPYTHTVLLPGWWKWCVCVCVCVCSCCECMWETDRQKQRQRRERLRWKESFPEWESFWIIFRRFVCHFPIVWFYFFKTIFSAMDGCVIFVIVVELQGKHWQFWQDHEARRISWGKYSHVLCKNFLISFSS